MKKLLVLLALLLIAGCAPIEDEQPDEVTFEEEQKEEVIQMRILFIIAQENFRDEELNIPKEILVAKGHSCDVASVSTEIATGMMGAKVTPDLAIADAKATDYEAIVIIGGSGALSLAGNSDILNLVRDFESQGKLVSAICIGPVTLARAGVLEGRNATVWSSAADKTGIREIEDGGATHTGEAVTVDGKIITANGPAAAKEFGNKIAEMLG